MRELSDHLIKLAPGVRTVWRSVSVEGDRLGVTHPHAHAKRGPSPV
jgi:hypothetical protein